MADFTQTRIDMLRRRWQETASPHVSLQLADLYRQQGTLDEAVDVLEGGLLGNPESVSLRVALGRYRMEAGDPAGAAETLKVVVDNDPSHLVANKLLVKAYVLLGERQRARDRLDLYSLLNDSDPEIEVLERSVASGRAYFEGPRPAGAERPAAPFELEPAGEAPDLSKVPRPRAVPTVRRGEDGRTLWTAASIPFPEAGGGLDARDWTALTAAGLFQAPPAPEVVAAAAVAEAATRRRRDHVEIRLRSRETAFEGDAAAGATTVADEPDAGTSLETVALERTAVDEAAAGEPAQPDEPAAEDVSLETVAVEETAVEPAAEESAAEPVAGEAPAEPERVWTAAELLAAAVAIGPEEEKAPVEEPPSEEQPPVQGASTEEGPPVEEPPAEEGPPVEEPPTEDVPAEEPPAQEHPDDEPPIGDPEPEAPPVEAADDEVEMSLAEILEAEESPRPTLTLARLYLDQGHLDEAEETFRAVGEREPGNDEVRRGLEAVAERRAEGADPTVRPPAGVLAGLADTTEATAEEEVDESPDFSLPPAGKDWQVTVTESLGEEDWPRVSGGPEEPGGGPEGGPVRRRIGILKSYLDGLRAARAAERR